MGSWYGLVYQYADHPEWVWSQIYPPFEKVCVRACTSMLVFDTCLSKFDIQCMLCTSPLFSMYVWKLITHTEYPDHWDSMDDKDEVKVFPLDPLEEIEEYERVTSQFLLTLPNVEILRVERVQNKLLWRRYVNRSKLMRDFDTSHLREELLFHGTRTNDPQLIYKGDEGFDMRYSAQGMWGQGNYFAVNSSYSHYYTFNINGVRKMFAAYVLTGNSCFSNPDGALRKPPPLKESGESCTSVERRYDSVCGTTGGTRVYITYDNEHAYPAYLITYRM